MARHSPFTAASFGALGIQFTPPPVFRFAQPIREASTANLKAKARALTEAWATEPTDALLVSELQFIYQELRRRGTKMFHVEHFTQPTPEAHHGRGT